MTFPSRYLVPVILVGLLSACDNHNDMDDTPVTPQSSRPPAATPGPVTADRQTPAPKPGEFSIDLTPGRVSIRATGVNELTLLEEIAARANFALLTRGIEWRIVSVDIEADNLHAALTELLRAYPYQIVYTPNTDMQREVLSEVFVSPDLVPADNDKSTSAAMTRTEDAPEPVVSDDEQADPDTQAQLQALQSDSETARAAAARDIEPTGEALIALTELLASDPSPEVRIATTQALQFSDDPLAIQSLAACLKDEYPAVIIACITTLEYIGDSSDAAQLQPLLYHYDASVRSSAARAIDSLQ